jgi:hypothetical protein
MAVVWDDEKKRYVNQDAVALEQRLSSRPTALMDPYERQQWELDQQSKSANEQWQAGAAVGGNKPAYAQNAGQLFDDLGNIAGNTIFGWATDLGDLAAGLGDLVVQGGNALQGKDVQWDQVFNDSDNPWTQWRRNEFEAQTEAGQAVSNLSRLASFFIPGGKWLTAPIGLIKASKVPVAAGLAGRALKGADALKDGWNVLTAGDRLADTAKIGDELGKIATGFTKGGHAAAATRRAARADDYLKLTYKEIADLPEAANWWRGVENNTKVFRRYIGERANVNSLGKALAWDAFASFNIYGEGDDAIDETVTDMLAEWGLPRINWFETDVNDTGLIRKFKQMGEGLPMSIAVDSLLDVVRVARFRAAFEKASPVERKQIAKAFDTQAEDIGRSLLKFGDPGFADDSIRAGANIQSKSVFRNSPWSQQQWDPGNDPWAKAGPLARIEGAVNTQRIANDYSLDLATAERQALNQWAANDPAQARLGQMGQEQFQQAGMNTPVQQWLGQREPNPMPPKPDGNPVLEQFTGQTPLQQAPGPDPAGALATTAPRSAVDAFPYPDNVPHGVGEIQPVQVQDITNQVRPRPPEPTVTPQTIRNAFEQEMRDAFARTMVEGPDGVMRSVLDSVDRVKRLMPRTRTDAIEYLMQHPPEANELGVIRAADSVVHNFFVNYGLKEGWAKIDPNTLEVTFNRNAALQFDRNLIADKQAQLIDEQFQRNNLVRMLGEQQAMPDQAAAKQLDEYQGQEYPDMPEPDPGQLDAERQIARAELEREQLDAAEEIRLSEVEVAKAAGAMDDATVVREMLGTTLDSVQRPEVMKAEVGRGWEVFGSDGESIARATTKKQADKLADAELERLRQAMVGRARQMEADATDQAINVTTGTPVYDSDLVGKVSLTDAQIDAIQKFSPSIQAAMRADWEKRTGGKAWININDLKGGSKKTFELTQGEMLDLADGIKALLQTGEITGPRARVLRNIADKLGTSMKLLEPQARVQRAVDQIVADTERFLSHGDFC